MGLRTKAYFSGVFLTFCSSMAAALGLGEIKLHSALNQPLDAEIQLLHVRGLTENEIIVAIATPDEFTRAGVERNYFVTDLDFDLDLNSAQGPVVRVTSSDPVREPFLNFVISARWPSGKLLREYTLLVDLPVFSGAQSAPVQAVNQTRSQPTSQSTANTTRPAPRANPSQPRDESSESVSSYTSDSYGPVGANETLWSIASKTKPDSSVSVQQTMLAIQRMNPEAFINGNINLLRRGQVLRIPDKDEIQQLSSRDAIQQVAEQNRSWSDRSSDKAQLEGSKSFSQTRTEPSTVEGRVKLSSSSDAKVGQGTGSEESENGEVSEALNQAQEELDAADRENADLQSRIQSMEEQIQTMERLVEVSSEEMRALELAAQQGNQAEQPEVAAETDPVSAAEVTDTTDTSSTPEVEASAEPNPAIETTPAAEPETVQPPVKAAPAQKSWLELVMDNILYIGAALGLLVLVLVIYLLKRKRDESYEEYDDYDANGDTDFPLDGDGHQEDKTLPLHAYDDREEFVEEEHALAEAETEDVVGECDIHIAYGQYDQAEEKLQRALEKDPGNTPVRLKLLEVFAVQGDADSFDQHYARLRMTGDADAIDRAAMIRSTIDGVGAFDEAIYDTSEMGLASEGDNRFDAATDNSFDTVDDTLDFDFNDVDELVDSSANTTGAEDFSADSLDFDLTQEEDITRIPTASGGRDANDEVAELDFDLADLDEAAIDRRAEAETSFATDSDTLGDIDFDMPESESGAFEDEKSADDLAADFDLEFGEDDRFTKEFSDDLVAERTTPKDEEGFDFADLELTNSAQDADSSFAEHSGDIDFDLDDDLTVSQPMGDEPPVLSSTARDSETDLDNLGFDDLESLELDNNQEDLQPSVGSDAIGNRRPQEGSSDFDVDFDLDKDINLDELDHELDALASNFDSSSANMEEPVLDFDDELQSGDFESIAALEGDDATDEAVLDLDIEADADARTAAIPASAARESNLDFEIPDFDPENDDDSNLDFLSDNDETATKLDLARAYIDMGDSDGAKDILDEIMDEGNDQQKREAEALLSRIA